MPAFPQSHLAVDDSQLPPGRRATRHLLPCVGSALLLACPLLPGGEGFVLFEKAMNERQTGAVWVRSIQVECWSGGNRAGQSRVCLQPAASEAFVLDIILIVECPPPPRPLPSWGLEPLVLPRSWLPDAWEALDGERQSHSQAMVPVPRGSSKLPVCPFFSSGHTGHGLHCLLSP